MSSLRNARPRCVSTVFSVTNSICAISRLVPPAAARSATRRSLGVSAHVPARSGVRGRRPIAASSARAPALHGPGPAARCARERVEERVARLPAPAGGAQGGAEVQQHARMLEPRRGLREHRDRFGEPLLPLAGRADQGLRA